MTLPNLDGLSFCLIRHGETDANRDGIIAGRLNVPLTDRGRAQARALADLVWPEPFALFCSAMDRARETAALGFPGREAMVIADVRERNWGIFEGRPIAELPKRQDCPEDGEDWQAFLERVGAGIAHCCAVAGQDMPLIVCHSGVVRAARILTGHEGVGSRPPNAKPILFRWTGTGHVEEDFHA